MPAKPANPYQLDMRDMIMKSALIALMMAASLTATVANASSVQVGPDAEAMQSSTGTYRTYMNYSGDCYAEQGPSTIQRCLVESTRGGGGAK